MKYLRYIINDKPINPENAGIMGVPVGIVALPVLTVFLFGAGLMDSCRYIRLMSLRRNKRANLRKYATAVIISLGHEPTKTTIQLLITA